MANLIGLCLSGGGARGAYQAGALKALAETGLLKHIEIYAGTSIGAANVSVLASTSSKVLEEAWLSIPPHPLRDDQPLVSKLLLEKLNIFEVGLYSMDVFAAIVMQYLDTNNLKRKQVYVTVSDGGDESKGIFGLLKASYQHYVLQKTKVIYLPVNELSQHEALEAIVASCSIPLLFPRVKQHHHQFYDGGLFDNTPLVPLVAAGCKQIIVIQLNHAPFFNAREYPGITIHEIKHIGSLGGIMDFSHEHIQQIFQWGYEDALQYSQNIFLTPF